MKPSTKNSPKFSSASDRISRAQAYEKTSRYDSVRPGYPDSVVTLLKDAARIADVGCGTGKLTAQLAKAGHTVFAIDPSRFMADSFSQLHPQIPVWRATAEATGLQGLSVDAVSCAQTWHWVDPVQASREWDRIIVPGGCALLVWNTIDVTAVEWTLRLTRIIHSGDIHKAGFVPTLAHPWTIAETLRTTFTQTLTPPQFHELMHTRSYWLRASQKEREKMTGNLDWYLYQHLGFNPDTTVELPYRTDAFLLRRSTE